MSCNFCFFFNFLVPKTYVFQSFTCVIIHMNFVTFSFRTFKLKNDISYIKYKFSHRFGKVYKWLHIYYSTIKIITFFKVMTMFIWIILNNLVWTYRECNFCWYEPMYCIHPNEIIIIWQLIVKPIKLLYYQQIRRVFVNEGRTSLPLN